MSGKGGARPGAGRPKGSPNRKTRETIERAEKGGQMPLEYMLGVMRDEGVESSRRDEMAKAAAPYCHSKISTVEHTGKGGGPIVIERRIVDSSNPDAQGF